MTQLPPDVYYAQLPRHLAAAAAVFHDAGRVLLVKPNYRVGTWELPGGAMSHEDSHPFVTASREVNEELGLDLDPKASLLAVDWVPTLDGRPALANYVFDGGRLTAAQAVRAIRLQVDELEAWQLAGAEDWDRLCCRGLPDG